jgi:hypothetical protein
LILITNAGTASRIEPGRKALPSLSLYELPFSFMLLSLKGEKHNVQEVNTFVFIIIMHHHHHHHHHHLHHHHVLLLPPYSLLRLVGTSNDEGESTMGGFLFPSQTSIYIVYKSRDVS